MPWHSRPYVPDFNHEPEFRWPSGFVGLKQEDLFGHLHDRFNTANLFIQDPLSFHHDALELAVQAHDQDHFYRLMQERKDLRLEELHSAFSRIISRLHSGYTELPDESLTCLSKLGCFMSYDCLLEFLASLTTQDKDGDEPFPDDEFEFLLPVNGKIATSDMYPFSTPPKTQMNSSTSYLGQAEQLPSPSGSSNPNAILSSTGDSTPDPGCSKRKRPTEDTDSETQPFKSSRTEKMSQSQSEMDDSNTVCAEDRERMNEKPHLRPGFAPFVKEQEISPEDVDASVDGPSPEQSSLSDGLPQPSNHRNKKRPRRTRESPKPDSEATIPEYPSVSIRVTRSMTRSRSKAA